MFRLLPMVLMIVLFSSSSAFALNSCQDGDFADMRGEAVVRIANDDPTNPFRYRPRCVIVSEATRVEFRALPNFGMHPLYGGTVTGSMATFDPASPIGPFTSGTQGDSMLMSSGEFPFFCDFHFTSGMMGSIRVVPELFAEGFD
ncbi:hypothetical protein [Dokdonella sp.]|uniref:hypothetical protein n=1 Tax=Dokdonella sp. TaxID=2291710 RepID=UPI003C3EB755